MLEQTWLRTLLVSAVLLAALGCIVWAARGDSTQVVRIAAISGSVTLDEEVAQPGLHLAVGSTLRCAAAAELHLISSDGSSFIAEGGTILRVGDPEAGLDLRCEQGRLRCTVQQQSPESPLLIHTPHGALRVIGTRFTLEVGPSTRLQVTSGAVEIVDSGTGHEQRVEAGCQAEIFGPGKPTLDARP